MLFIRDRGTFYATFPASVYATSALGLFSWIPIIVYLVGLYGIYVTVVGLEEMHGTTTTRALLAALRPAVLSSSPSPMTLVVAGWFFRHAFTIRGLPEEEAPQENAVCPIPSPVEPGPEETTRAVRAAFPKCNDHLRTRDEMGALFEDGRFVQLYVGTFSRHGQANVSVDPPITSTTAKVWRVPSFFGVDRGIAHERRERAARQGPTCV